MSEAIHIMEKRIDNKPFPIMRRTQEMLECEDDPVVSIEQMVMVVANDPGLAVNLLRKANTTPHEHLNHRLTNIEYLIMMYGMNRVRQLSRTLPVLENVVKPEILQRIRNSIGRATLCATLSREWAMMRRDMVATEVYLAALLHNVGEIGLWLFAPEETAKVDALASGGNMSRDEAYYLTLGYSQEQLSAELNRKWNMPSLVLDALNSANSLHPRVLGIMLSYQLTHFRDCGWGTEEAKRCIDQLSAHLCRPYDETLAIITELVRRWELLNDHYGIVVPPGEGGSCAIGGGAEGALAAPMCITPQPILYAEVAARLGRPEALKMNVEEVLDWVVKSMHDALGLNRVVFAHLMPDLGVLHANYVAGGDDAPEFSRFSIELSRHSLFKWMMTTPKALWINELNRRNVASLLPEEFTRMVGVDTFFVQSVFVKGKPFGIFYADREVTDCQLDAANYKRFQVLANLTVKFIEYYRSHTR